MKAPPFSYVRPDTLDEVFELLEAHGDEARLLAGGQSLLATLNLRLSSPALLIDITRVGGLSGITVANGQVSIGALTTHAEIERSREIADALPLLAAAAPHIAHPAIRNVGTLGGSLAMADPATEWPACCIALDARFVLASKSGHRRVRAREFFHGLYATDLHPGEVLTAAEIPIPAGEYRSAFLELTRRRGDYAIVGIAAIAKHSGGSLSDVRLAYLGVGPTPMLARTAMAAIENRALSPAALTAAADALETDLDPEGDAETSAATRAHLARVLTGRALTALAA